MFKAKIRSHQWMRTATQLAVLSACALAAQMVQAQSSVQIYGLLDLGLTHVTNIKGSGTVNQMSSGIMEGSRLGFKGTEDLGGGYKTVFTMESRLESNTGGNSNRPLSGSLLPNRLATPEALGLGPSAAPMPAPYNTLGKVCTTPALASGCETVSA